MRTLVLTTLAALLLLEPRVWAGPRAGPKCPAGPAPSESAAATEPPTPFQPHIDDPMLAPAPRPQRVLGGWQEARELLSARSTELRAAEANLLRAEGIWRQALAALLPFARASAGLGIDPLHPSTPLPGVAEVSATPGAGSDGVQRAPTAPLGAASVSVSQALVDVAAWRGLASARANTESARADLRDVRRRLTQGLASALIAVVAAERAAEINRTSLRHALERALLTERTFQLGAATQLDVLRVNQDVAVARSALIAGDEQLRRTREALGEALGIDGEVGVSPEFTLGGLVEEVRRHCRPLAPGELRPDLVAASKQVDAAAASRAQAQAGYLPRLGLAGTAGAFTTEPGPGRLATWSVAAVLSVPLWEGGLRRGVVEERTAAQAAAAEAAEAQRRAVFFEIARARRGEEVARRLMEAAAEARDLAQKTDQMTRRSFEIGRATSLELVQSAVALREAELSLSLREFEWIQARLDAFLTEASCEG